MTQAQLSLELEPLGRLTITIAQQTHLPGTPAGGRLVGEAATCRWEGERIQASQHGQSASDWVRILPDSSVEVDARIVLRTDDGATIAMTYRGKAERPPVEGGAIYTAPTFETNDPRYAWLNHIQAVAKGRRDGSTLVYDLYALR
jgi:hypothetical protein